MHDMGKWEDVVKRLTEQTMKGQTVWRECGAEGRDDAVGRVYETNVMNRDIVCYEYEYMDYTGTGPEPERETGVAIEFVDQVLKTKLWRLPETRFHHQLLDAIQYRGSGAADFLGAFLK